MDEINNKTFEENVAYSSKKIINIAFIVFLTILLNITISTIIIYNSSLDIYSTQSIIIQLFFVFLCSILISLYIFNKKKRMSLKIGESASKKENLHISMKNKIEELEMNQNRFRSLVEKASDLTVIFTLDGKFDYISPSVRIGGYLPEHFQNKFQADFFHVDDMPLLKASIDDALKNAGGPVSLSELRFKNSNGEWIWLEGELTALPDTPGINGIVFNGRDVTEKKNAQKMQMALYDISEATNKSRDLYHLFSSIHYIIEELMPANNFYISLYDEATQMLEFPYYVDEVDENPGSIEVGRGLTGYVIRTGESQIIDEKRDLELRDAGEVDLVGELCKIWIGIPLKGKEDIIGVMVVQDYNNSAAYGEREKELLTFVSEQIANAIEFKRAQDNIHNFLEELQNVRDTMEENAHQLLEVNIKLEESEQKLIKLNANKDKFFSIISHDLKGPFTGLLGITEMLVEDYDDFSDEEIKELIVGLHKSAKNGYELLEGLLEWSRLQRGAIEFKPTEINLSKVSDMILELSRPNAVRKNLTLESKIKINEIAYADENMVSTVIRNLIANAIKFTESGGRIEINSEKMDDFVKVCITDDGIGISEEDIKKLFRIEIHHTTVGTNKEKGTGVGLILCKELIEKNHGKIWVESEFGKGSMFCFTLPISQ
jgi:PAS domain S-box-containing protein